MSEIIIDGKEIEIKYYPDGAPRIVYDGHLSRKRKIEKRDNIL